MASARERLIAQLTRSLRSGLPSSAVVVERPDHPLLFSGPDIVTGSEGKLLAAFFPKASELTSWKTLLARLTAVRLALPVHTKCVLVSTEAGSLPNELTEEGFDEVCTPREAARTEIIMSQTKRTGARSSRLLASRTQAMVNYGAIIHVRQVQETRWEGIAPVQRVNREDRRLRRLTRLGESYIGALEDKTYSSALASLQSFARKAYVENYDLVDGVPELKRHALNVVISDADLKRGLDPGKPMRASAFAGWLLTNSAATDNLNDYIKTSERELDRTRERLWSLQQRRIRL